MPKLTESEIQIFKNCLPKIKELTIIKYILDADFYPKVDGAEVCEDGRNRKNELNSYVKEGVLYSLLYPYIVLFFSGRNCLYVAPKNTEEELIEYFEVKLSELWFGMHVLSGLERK